MGTKAFNHGSGNILIYDDVLNPSFGQGVWGGAPIWAQHFDQSIALFLREQFTTYDATATTGDYLATAATSGTVVISTTVPGAIFIDAGAVTANQGINLQRLKTGFVPAANKSIWAEWRIALTATTPPVTRAQIFVGLAASDATIIASGSQSTNNRIGWQIENGGLLVTTFTSDKAGTATTKTGPTLVDATVIKLGFFYDGVADTLQQYVNGVASGTPVTTTNIPKLVMYPSLVCQADGTDRPNMTASGYQIMQLR